MNSLHTQAKRRQAMGRLYTRIEDRSPTRDISFDEYGVIALCGSQGTNQVYFAERLTIDEENETMDFRTIRFEPTYKKGMFPNPRTGVPEFGNRLTTCKYIVADVTTPLLGPQINLGGALRQIQEEFTYEVKGGNHLSRGSVNSDGDVSGVYRRLFETPRK